MNHKEAFIVIVLSLAMLIGCAGNVIPSPTATFTPEPMPAHNASPVIQFARDYFSAVIQGDKQGAEALLVPSARCTPGDLRNIVNSQLASFGSAEVRAVDISEKDTSHTVEIYAPGAQAACVAFEFRTGSSPVWSPASICIVVETGICDTWSTWE
jgi:hypothetical protein